MKHLAMASFRGRSFVKPFFDEDGKLLLKKLDNWNVLLWNNKLWWNPSSEPVPWFEQGVQPTLQELPKSEVCWLKDDMPIDVPGLMIYLR